MPDDREHFQKAYTGGQKPWDSGKPSAQLVQILDAGLLPGRTLLEFGCGTGTNAIELARRGYTVTASDYIAEAVATAREKAQAAKVKIDFHVADITKDDPGGPYDVLFDRGVYHSVRPHGLNGFLKNLEKATRKGTRWLTLAGNSKEKTEYGPPRVSEQEFRAELGPHFNFLQISEFRFETGVPDFEPLGWSILMERK